VASSPKAERIPHLRESGLRITTKSSPAHTSRQKHQEDAEDYDSKTAENNTYNLCAAELLLTYCRSLVRGDRR